MGLSNAAGQRLPLKFAQVYAPHNGYSEEVRGKFYVEQQIKLAEPACRTVVMGYFNARTGRGAADKKYVGRFSAETRDEAGQRMAAFVGAKNLYITNSFSEKPRGKRWS